MSETVEQACAEPETIRRTMLWSFELEKAVAEEAQKIDSTPIEVITKLVRKDLSTRGYHFNGDRGNNGNESDATVAPTEAEAV